MTDTADVTLSPHQPVLFNESIALLQPTAGGRYVDGTLGAGGHAAGILEAIQPDGRLLGLDIDSQALDIAGKRLSKYKGGAVLAKASYSDIAAQMSILGWPCANGIILDFGVSSMQLDNSERGFSFIKDAPLDMRFDKSQPLTAARIINTWSEKELADILWSFGEEPRSKQIAREIIASRPVDTTLQLAALVLRVYKGKRGKTHPATRTFQALRIAVNNELETLKKGLTESLNSLCSRGRLVVISFHSLEDRQVKKFFQQESRDCICSPGQLVCTCGHKATLKILTKKAIIPSQEEVSINPRSRSAKLRAAEKF